MQVRAIVESVMKAAINEENGLKFLAHEVTVDVYFESQADEQAASNQTPVFVAFRATLKDLNREIH